MSELLDEHDAVSETQLGGMSPVVKPYLTEIHERYGINLLNAFQVALSTNGTAGYLVENGITYLPVVLGYIASQVLPGNATGKLIIKGAMAALTLNEDLNAPNSPGHKRARTSRMAEEIMVLSANKQQGEFGSELAVYAAAKRERNLRQTRRWVHAMRLDMMYQYGSAGLAPDVIQAFTTNMQAGVQELQIQGFIGGEDVAQLSQTLTELTPASGQLHATAHTQNTMAAFYRAVYALRGEEKFLPHTLSDVLATFEAPVLAQNATHYHDQHQPRLTPFEYMVLQALGPSNEYRRGSVIKEVGDDHGIVIDHGLIDDFFSLVVLPE